MGKAIPLPTDQYGVSLALHGAVASTAVGTNNVASGAGVLTVNGATAVGTNTGTGLIPPNSAPAATVADHSLHLNEWSRVASWISYSDPQNTPATQYQFWDAGRDAASGYFYTPGDPHHAAGAPFTVSAAELNSVWIRGGQVSGSETMYVRGFDGTYWSDWDTFTFTTLPNAAPVAGIADHSLHVNEWSRVASWISYADAENNPAVQYQFRDDGAGFDSGYFWTPGNHHHTAGTVITVSAADLANVWVRGGQAGGSENLDVRVFDGTDWSDWDTFAFTTLPNTAPVARIADHTLHTNEWSQVTGWISYSDAEKNPATQYEFRDDGAAANSGYFWTPDNHHHAANTTFTVAAADLADLWVRGGQVTGQESLWVRAFDGTSWSNWDLFSLRTIA